jgi:hypothetical protein
MTILEQDEARSFLLAQLSPEETARFEERLLADDALVAETEAAEAELLDEFVRGSLSADESAAIAKRFRNRSERIVFATALAAYGRPRPQKAMRWSLAIAASLIVVASAVLLARRLPSPLPQAPVRRATLKPAPAPAPIVTQTARQAQIATFSIALTATRDGDEIPHLELTRAIDAVALHIRINPADRFPAYEVDLSTSDGAPVWNGRATRAASSAELVVEIPASSMQNGEHQIAVTGLGEDGSREELGYQMFDVRRR